jgi:hypothetical protein
MKLLPETKAQREERLRDGIAAVHLITAYNPRPVGFLARLYDRLHVVADQTDVFAVSGNVEVNRKQAMYNGGIKFTGKSALGEEVAVNLRRTTTCYSDRDYSRYGELSIFLTSTTNRVRARLSTWDCGGAWDAEGTIGLSEHGAYMTKRAPELQNMNVVRQLIGDVTLLAISAYADVEQIALPAAPPAVGRPVLSQ